MKALKIVFAGLLVIVLGAAAYAWYVGFLTSPKVEERVVGPYFFVQYERWGDYSETGLYVDSIDKALQAIGVTTELGFGIYYDNPASGKPASEWHSIVGRVLHEPDSATVAEVVRRGFRVERMGKTNCTVVEFPMRTQMSIMAGIVKAYPAIEKYRSAKNYSNMPVIEIYYPKHILYAMEISE